MFVGAGCKQERELLTKVKEYIRRNEDVLRLAELTTERK